MENQDIDNNEEVEATQASEEITEPQEEQVEKTELEIAQDKANEVNDKYLRLYSEFDNYRKRTAKEKIDIITTASAGVIKEMLPVVDDFKRAMDANKELEDAQALKDGFELIFNKMYKALEAKGLQKIEAKGEVFNADVHEALTNIPAPTEDMKGKVVDVIEEGYQLGDKIIRFPKVVVGQ